MIPGVDPRQLKAMMRQMGMSQEDISATKVIIETPDKTFVFENPNVQKVVMQGQTSFQIIGDYSTTEPALEINISCPNVKEGGVAFGTDLKLAHKVVSEIRKSTSLPLITKLSPNVTNIADFARAVVDAGHIGGDRSRVAVHPVMADEHRRLTGGVAQQLTPIPL